MVAIKLHTHQPVGISESIFCTRGPRIIPPPPETGKRILCYDVWFSTKGGVAAANPTPTVATPTISSVDNGDGTATVTLSCATSNALIFWSSDGSYPGPFNVNGSSKTPYSAPVTVNVPCQFQCRAWYPGWIGSVTVKQNLT
jgi:hypothetical protein